MWYQSNLKARVEEETFHTPHQHAANTSPSESIHALEAMRRQRSDGSFKLRVPSFLGENDLDAYLAWEKEMELVFGYHHYTQEKKVRKAVSTFIGHAINWWEETAFIRRYLGESQITSWCEMKAVMKKRFVSTYNGRDVHPKLRRMYQHSISADGYYQEMEPFSRKATRHEQQNKRRRATRSHCVVASNPADIRGDKSLETHKGTQTAKLVQGDKEKSSIMPNRTRNVVSLPHAPECINNKITFSLDNGEVVSANEETKPEGEENKAAVNTLLLEEIPMASKLRLEETALATHQTVQPVQPLLCKESVETVSMIPSMEPTIPRNREEKKLELMLRTAESSKTVGRSNPIVQPINLHNEVDLRTNPFKGGGDGVILDGPNMISSPSREEEEEHSPLGRQKEGLDVCFGKLEIKQEKAHGWTQDGMDLDARAHEVKKAHMFKTVQEVMPCLKPNKRLSNVWIQTKEEKEEKRPPELKPNKKPFCALCWTWPRKQKRKGHGFKAHEAKLFSSLHLGQGKPDQDPNDKESGSTIYGPWKRQSYSKPKLSRKRPGLRRQKQWALGKSHGSDGSEEESKAREARPPDGQGLNQFVEEEEKRPMARPKMFYVFMFSYFCN